MQQDAENWGLLQTLFHLAEETPPDQRERVLAERCDDQALVKRTLRMLSGADDIDRRRSNHPKYGAPTRIGPYILARLLGSGGIGSVYLVERIVGAAPQRFALKMLAPHVAGHSFIDRFHREQHILGSLNHSHIARFVDAGQTESGQQYLVMEYVDGEHLDEYCDHLKLAIAARLRIFLTICEAVFYAHRNLVVHLDLKPSNILVGQDGSPKLLDFGTSKLIDLDTQLTTTVMATPAYASPEQLRNEPVTTSCDIYALGAILFELLSGRRPYANSSVAKMMERAIAEQQPEDLLSAITAEAAEARGTTEARLRQELTGDLQTVVAKCLMPRPAERYASVDGLALDIQRYLNGEPVLARSQTVIYKLGKFVRRHRIGVLAGVTASILLIGSVSYGAWRQQQALREARRAEQMQSFMHRLFRLANPKYMGRPAVTVPEFLQLGVKKLPDYIQNPADLLHAKVALAESMFDSGDLADAEKIFSETTVAAKAQGDVNAWAESEAYAGDIAFRLGKVETGKQLSAEALKLSQQTGVSPAVRVWAADFYALNRENLGMMSADNLTLLRTAAAEARRNNLPLHDRATAIYNLATILEYRGFLDEAQPLYDEALNLYKQDPDDICDQSAVYGDLGYLYDLKNQPQLGTPLLQRSYDGYKACSGAASRDALSTVAYLGGSLNQQGRPQDAIRVLEASWPDWQKVPGGYVSLSELPLNLALSYVAAGRYSDAEKLATAIIEARHASIASSVPSYPEFILAEALAGEHRDREALPHADLAYAKFSHKNPLVRISPFGVTLAVKVANLDAEIRGRLGLAPHP